MKYTIEEKRFIAENRPIVEIEGVEFSTFVGCEGDGESPDLEGYSFAAQEAIDANDEEENCEGAFVTFRFRDRGADYEQKHVFFTDFAQFFDCESDEVIDLLFDSAPDIVFDVVADKDGRFSVTVPMWMCREREDETVLDRLKADRADWQFNKIVVCNQFVAEEIGTLLGEFAPDGEETDYTREDIRYYLVPDHAEDEDEEETAEEEEDADENNGSSENN